MSANNIGMMDGAYFVGRNEILSWINTTLQLDLAKVEEVRLSFSLSLGFEWPLISAIYGNFLDLLPVVWVRVILFWVAEMVRFCVCRRRRARWRAS